MKARGILKNVYGTGFYHGFKRTSISLPRSEKWMEENALNTDQALSALKKECVPSVKDIELEIIRVSGDYERELKHKIAQALHSLCRSRYG